jgi:hypothetical protein
MQRFLFTFLCLFCAVFLFSCENEDVPAKATISMNKQFVKTGEEITFKTTNGGHTIYHEWDFGNGLKGLGLETKTKYNTSGVYNIKLSSLNHNKDVTTSEATILAGSIYYHGIVLYNLNFLDPEGKPWDSDGTGPDLRLQISGLPINISGIQYSNVTQRDFPIYVGRFDNLNYELTGKQYTISLFEYDSNGLQKERLIKSWVVEPYKLYLNDPFLMNRAIDLPGDYPKISISMSLN